MAGSETYSEYESGPSTKNKLRTEIMHKNCETTTLNKTTVRIQGTHKKEKNDTNTIPHKYLPSDEFFNNLTEIEGDYVNALSMALANLVLYPVSVHWVNEGVLNKKILYQRMLEDIEQGPIGYVTILKNTSHFISLKYNITQVSNLRQRDRRFLFLTENEDPKILFQHPKLEYYPHHLMVCPEKTTGDIKMWTQKFVGVEELEKPILVETFFKNRTFDRNRPVFWDKTRNLQGRVIKVGSLTYPPYTIIENITDLDSGNVDSTSGAKNFFFDGLEAQLVITFCIIRNCSLRLLIFPPDQWGSIYHNGSSFGLLGALKNHIVEVGVACIYSWYNDLFDSTHYTAKSAITLLAPMPELVPDYITAFLPFDSAVWTNLFRCVIFTTIMYYLVVRIACKIYEQASYWFEGFTFAFLEVFAIFTTQSASDIRFRQHSVRTCQAGLLLGCLILTNAYGGLMKSICTIPYYTDPINTKYKFAESGLAWGAPHEAWIRTIQNTTMPVENLLLRSFQIKTYDELEILSFSRRFGIAVERLQQGSIAFEPYIKKEALEHLMMLEDDIYHDYAKVQTIRGWPLLKSLNQIILRCREMGLVNGWAEQAILKYFDNRVEQGLRYLVLGNLHKPKLVVLNLGHILGPFLLFQIGLILAFFTFLLEIIWFEFYKSWKLEQTIKHS